MGSDGSEHGHLTFPLGACREAEDDGECVTDRAAHVEATRRKQLRKTDRETDKLTRSQYLQGHAPDNLTSFS